MQITRPRKEKLARDLAPMRRYRARLGKGAGTDQHGGGEHGGKSMRHAYYRGRQISVLTHYEIKIDDVPLKTHVIVAEDGKVHCHALPSYGFSSVIDLVRQVIDTFDRELPEDELAALVGKTRKKRGKKTRKKAKKKTKKKTTKKAEKKKKHKPKKTKRSSRKRGR